jgi:hypothetical protein
MGNRRASLPGGAGIVVQTYYRGCKEYGNLQVDQGGRVKELPFQRRRSVAGNPGLKQENSKLKRRASDLRLEKLVLKEIPSEEI